MVLGIDKENKIDAGMNLDGDECESEYLDTGWSSRLPQGSDFTQELQEVQPWEEWEKAVYSEGTIDAKAPR